MNPNKRKNTTRVICLILAAILLLSLISSALIIMVNAASSAEIEKELLALREKQAEIKAQSDALEKSIAENKDKTRSIVSQKAEIDQQMEISRQKIENLNAQLQQYSLLIAQKQTELDEAEAREEALTAQYKARLRSMEETGSVSYWSILFKARSFSDLLDRVDMIQEIAKSDQLMMEQLAEATRQVEEERAELEEQLKALELTQTELADEQTTLEEKRAEADKLILQMQIEYNALSEEYLTAEEKEAEIREQVKKTETEYFNALAKEEAERLRKQAEEEAKRRAQAAANASSGSGSSSSSGASYLFPLTYSTGVTSAYGYRIHPINGNYGFHTGVDLAAGEGTAIYATRSGTVTGATYGEANGYYVTINHGDGFSSLYAHMTHYIVSVGDSVKQGQVIGYVGSTGWSSGPHLHFEILCNGSNVNPMNYISLP